MAIISGTTVNWVVSPRIITIPSPINAVTIDDLQDTLQDLEDDVEGIVWPYLRNMSGGEALGGSVSVGYTMELQNAQLQFEGRTTPVESGSATTADTSGTILIATGGLFQTNGITRGDTVYNSTTGSIATVLSVESQTQLTSQVLTGGSRADWQVTDGYTIYNNTQCNISGGNLVAVDSGGTPISPVLQSPNTYVVRTSSSSATALDFDTQVQDLSDRIETLRPTHSGYGPIFYWDPENGNDANDGLLRSTGVKTFAAAHALVSPGDTIIGLTPSAAHGFVVDQINITKQNIQVRCSGDNFWIKPATDVVPVIFNDADYSSISGIRISKATAGSANGINIINSDRVLVEEVNCHQETGDSVYISGSYMPHMKNSWFHGCTGNGITGVTGCNHLRVENCFISNNQGNGIDLRGTTIKSTQIGWGSKVQFSGGYGIYLDTGPRRLTIDDSAQLVSNTSGDVNYIAANQVSFAREINNAPVANIQSHVEALQESHHMTGGDCYLDPINGNDANDGLTAGTALKTWAAIETTIQSGITVNLVADPTTDVTTLAERIVTTKSNFRLQGPGDYFHIHPINGDVGSIIALGTSGTHATGVHMSGFTIHTDDLTSTNNGIYMFGDGNKFTNIKIDNVPGDGFKSADCSNTILERVEIITAGDQGIHITNCDKLKVKDCFIDTPALAAIRIDGNGSGDSKNTDIDNCIIKDASTGIHIYAGCEFIKIRANNRFVGTVSTQIYDLGTNTHIETNIINNSIWANTAALTVGKFIALGKALFKGKGEK